MSLSVAVMAHPARLHFVEELLPQLPGAVLVLDKHNDRWDTGRRSLLAFDPSATHHAVIQDDALLCEDFLEGAKLACRAAGANPIGLYVGRVRPHQSTVTPAVKLALRARSPWLVAPGPYWGVGIVIPTADIKALICWADEHPEIRNYDRRVAAWYERQARECWYTVPSLVDHRPVEENPSLVKGRIGNRRAHKFLHYSALQVDWSVEPVYLNRTVVYSHLTTGTRRRVVIGSPKERQLARNPRWCKGDQELQGVA